MSNSRDLDEFDRLFSMDIAAIEKAVHGPYAEAIDELLHLSGRISLQGRMTVIPTEIYSQLITLVERASQMNISQAALKERITALGGEAVGIAKKTKSLAKLLAQ